jgi:single-strand DNA-binding protein
MSDINSVTLVGRLTKDAELAYLNTGTAKSRLSLAVNKKGKQEHVNFFDVELWGKTAEALQQYLTKGKMIAISGELKQDRWEHEGKTRSKITVTAFNIQLLGGNNTSNTSSGNTGNAQPFEDDIPF